jgi:hypothetical protein
MVAFITLDEGMGMSQGKGGGMHLDTQGWTQANPYLHLPL